MLGLQPAKKTASFRSLRSKPTLFYTHPPPFKKRNGCGKEEDQFLLPAAANIICPPTRYRPVPAATGTPVATHCVKSLRSACLIRRPYQDMAGLSQPLQKAQGLRQPAFPLSTRHKIYYVNFTQCSALFAPFAPPQAFRSP